MREKKKNLYSILLAAALALSVLLPASFPVYATGPAYTIAQAKKNIISKKSYKEKYHIAYGVDVSRWQEDIDWKKARRAGVNFAIIRLGNRDKITGHLILDPYFRKNIKGAHEAGVDVGVYFFTQARNTREARKEAAFCMKYLKPYKKFLAYPVYIDIEPCGGRLDKAKLSKRKKTDICLAFCKALKAKGYSSGVYTSYSFYYEWLYAKEMEKYSIWMANYARKTDYPRRYDLWQCSSSGRVSGIHTRVDLDLAYFARKPSVPGKIRQTDGDEEEIALKWNRSKLAEGYKVYCLDENGRKVKNVFADEESKTIKGLKPGRKYQIRVRAFWTREDGRKVYGDKSPASWAYTTPDEVTGIRVTERRRTSVDLQWKAQDGAAGYRIRLYDPETDAFETIGTSKTNRFTVTGLKKASPYRIMVQAWTKINKEKIRGEWSELKTVWTGIGAVKRLKVTARKKSSVKVSWKPTGEEIIGYRVRIQDHRGKIILDEETGERSVGIHKLRSGRTYRVIVNALFETESGKELSGASAVRKFSTR